MAWRLRCIAGLFAAAVALAQPAGGAGRLQTPPIGNAQVAAVRDGRTLLLADRREFRLAAIEVPPQAGLELRKSTAGAARRGAWKAPAATAKAVRSASPLPARAENPCNRRRWRLLRRDFPPGSATWPAPGELLQTEQAARAGRRGLWADPNFAPLAAENLAPLAARMGQFALVQGKILSVHASCATLCLNFGRRRTRNFSVIILRRNERKFSAAGVARRGVCRAAASGCATFSSAAAGG